MNETLDKNMKISGSELFLGPKTNVTNSGESGTAEKT